MLEKSISLPANREEQTSSVVKEKKRGGKKTLNKRNINFLKSLGFQLYHG